MYLYAQEDISLYYHVIHGEFVSRITSFMMTKEWITYMIESIECVVFAFDGEQMRSVWL